MRNFKEWSRNDKLAFTSILVGVVGVVLALVQVQTNRLPLGSVSTSARPDAAMAASSFSGDEASAGAEAADVLEIQVPGSLNQITLRAAGSRDAPLQEGFSLRGSGVQRVVFLKAGQKVSASLFGNENTLRIASDVSSQVRLTDTGHENKVDTLSPAVLAKAPFGSGAMSPPLAENVPVAIKVYGNGNEVILRGEAGRIKGNLQRNVSLFGNQQQRELVLKRRQGGKVILYGNINTLRIADDVADRVEPVLVGHDNRVLTLTSEATKKPLIY